MKVKHLKQLRISGDIFICNDKAFKKILEGKSLSKNIDPYNKSNDYFHFVRTSSEYHPEQFNKDIFSKQARCI